MRYKAYLFDLNGTMIDDMWYHVKAWHRLFHELGAPLTVEETRAQCYGKNGEVLERVFPGRFSQAEKDRISIEKEQQYQREFRPSLRLITGLDRLLDRARKEGIRMAIGSAAMPFNIDFVLDGLDIRHYFEAVISADDVQHSKPHPETYLLCAEKLNMAPADCLVFEDVPKGVESARNAGMDCVTLTTLHGKEEFEGLDNILLFMKDYDNFTLPVIS